MKYQIQTTAFDNIEIKLIDKFNLLILKKNQKELFLKLTENINLQLIDNSFVLSSNTINNDDLNTLVRSITYFTESSSNEVFKKKLALDGLGFKLTTDNKTLEFKLGYSHLISLPCPKELKKTGIKKKKITFESNDKIKIGNFAQKIYSLRKYDKYKGKGFSFLGVKKKLKEIKKK